MAGIKPSELANLDAQISAQLDLLRHSNTVEAEILELLQAMRRELISKLAEGNLTEFSKARLNRMLDESTAVIEGYYKRAQAVLYPSLEQSAQVAATQAITGLAVELTATIPSRLILESLITNLLIEGAPSAAWWERQSADTAFKFANAVRQGVAQGETNSQIFKRVGEVTDLAGRNSRALVQTSVMQVASDARLKTIDANKDIYKGYRQLSTLDGHTTDICIVRSGLEWDFDKQPIGHNLPFQVPPLHWNCRSLIMGIRRTFKELGIDLEEPTGLTRSSAEGQIDRETSFEAFLSRRTIEQQNEQLGVGRAELWRNGTITLRQLLDSKGNPLSLAELKAKYL